MKKLLACALAASVAIFGLTACSNQDKADAHKLKIVTTNFAEYDFARQITVMNRHRKTSKQFRTAISSFM